MIKKRGKESLAEKITGVLSTTPASFDPEDAHVDDTSAKLLNEDFEDDQDDDEELLSKFRKQNIDLLEDVDERYAGKRGSRKDMASSDESGDDLEEEEDNPDENGDNDSMEDEENDSDNEESDDDESGSDFDEEGIDLENIDEEDANFSHFKESDASAQVKKGLCVRNQMNLWENLLEMRIQLQKCLVTSNKLPQKPIFLEIKKSSGQQFTDKVSETKTNVCNIIDKLLQLQKVVLNKYPETKNLGKGDNKVVNDDDEEIPSDTEDELEKDDSDAEEEESPKKRRKLSDYEQIISDNHSKYTNYRNSVIQKWNEKTRMAVAKNNLASHSVLNQIQHNLNDKQKLIKRTQLRRSEFKIIGEKEKEDTTPEPNEDNIEVKNTEEHNTNIFDDDDFYHQLLRELIEVKSADITDPVQLGRQWIQLQNLRSKMKRKIDTKATKGRKIRYAVHTKLVNFMAPIDEYKWTDEAKTELYNSLFGKRV
ncbi:unnamed protein product [Brassicogethes aeneus]|uniref:Protein AATF n=1 Tax=Brassicogethes aeneus TaxID=1431903 RepID=A0A9P0FCK7_BRAAE|nr:unnamed protein product [Brassicogethes aeneus]